MRSPLELVGAHPWQRAVFTTYSLSLSFFESAVLDQLVRGGARSALILADVDGVRGALSEQGARRAGKEYDIEPVKVPTGVFHAKVTALVGEGECHVLVGSGNLTFGGWGGNFELFEHVHSASAADAIRDTSDFFDGLAEGVRARHGAQSECRDLAAVLRQTVDGVRGDGRLRLFHNLRRSILDQISELTADLGGATRLVAASPFWDGATAINSLCDSLKVDRVHVHAHPSGVVRGSFGSNWPAVSPKGKVVPVCVDGFNLSGDRRLSHAKAIEIICRKGRLIISGSANATRAALGDGGNVETSIVRIEKTRSAGWTFKPAYPLEQLDALDDDTEEEETIGILRATLEEDTLYGQILQPRLQGSAAAFLITSEGSRRLGKVQLDDASRFTVVATGLEVQILQGNRFTLGIENEQGRAEGFISFAAFTEISKRSGALASRLFAMLAGTETPADVAAVMSWIYDNPNVLNRNLFGSHAAAGTKSQADDETIPVNLLGSSLDPTQPSQSAGNKNSQGSWKRFVDAFLASLRERRGPFQGQIANPLGDDEDDEDEDGGTREPARETDPWIKRSMATFYKVFGALLTNGNTQRFFWVAFDLAQYVCRRLEPEPTEVSSWLSTLIRMYDEDVVDVERRDTIAAAILLLHADDASDDGARVARLRLLRMKVAIQGACPDMAAVDGFRAALRAGADFDKQWERVRAIRTMPEQVQEFLKAVEKNSPSSGYPDLPLNRDEWPTLARALEEVESREDFMVVPRGTRACPHCSYDLPREQIGNLRSKAVATAKNCCGLVLVCAEV
ncbi:hypothetical protein [Bradyrhizobium sp. RT4b]|uniref:hypothetical protein n=1 Tax=unclassified Bradyrhizobium TaxID=2631580 RepID=UPI003397A3CD